MPRLSRWSRSLSLFLVAVLLCTLLAPSVLRAPAAATAAAPTLAALPAPQTTRTEVPASPRPPADFVPPLLHTLPHRSLDASASITPTESLTPTSYIDFDQDENHDSIPDELYRAIDDIVAIIEREGYTDEVGDAISAMDMRLHYADETRTIQQQGAILLDEFLTADDSRRQAIITEIAALEAQMMEDPNYAQVMESFQKIIAARRAATRLAQHRDHMGVSPAQGDNTLFLPLILSPSGSVGIPVGFTPVQGDIFLVDGPGSFAGIGWNDFVYQVWWSHAGVYDENDFMYESIASGVWLQSFTANWLLTENRIWQGRAPTPGEQARVIVSLGLAKTKYGTDGRTPYNFVLWDKQRDDALYCSQLAWKIYQGAGLDIDSNDPLYAATLHAKWGSTIGPLTVSYIAWAAVAPDEIYLDVDVLSIAEFTLP